MNNFIYSIPTTIYFGKGQISNLGQVVKGYGSKALLLYGGGSIKKSGLYDTVKEQLTQAGVACVELGGVEPNPRITSVREGARICKEQQVEVILPVGGGSTIDCAKAIAAGAHYEGDPWDLVIDHSKIKEATPIVSVLTLSATGSEMDCGGVITNFDTNVKRAISSKILRPKASILDPEYTYTVSRYQTGAGTADIMSHLFEVYFSRAEGTYMQDRMIEALLKTCIRYGRVAMDHPADYDARANLMWASSWAINDFVACGKGGAWSVHPMEHELSAFYDITHGVGLAILTPHWMRYVLDETTVGKFVEFGVNVWGIDPSLAPMEIANRAIDATASFLREQLELASTLREVGIGEENLEIMAKKAAAMGLANGYRPLTWEDVLAIYKACL